METASSMDWVAPFPEAGRKEWAASPILTTRPPGDAHFGCGSRQYNSKLTMVFGGVSPTSSLKMGAQGSDSTPLSILFNTSSASIVSVQDSLDDPAAYFCQYC
jgi:hypothetical protein